MKKLIFIVIIVLSILLVSCQNSEIKVEKETNVIYKGRIMEKYDYNQFQVRINDSSDKFILTITDDVKFKSLVKKDFYVGNNISFEYEPVIFDGEVLEIIPYYIHENIEVTYTVINKEDAKKVFDSEEVTIVDVREAYEYESGHIQNAILIPLGTIQENVETILTDKDEKIFVYCKSGNRSKQAAEILVKLGYTNIFEMGGINNWPYEIVK